jgi:hypothetical protein
LFRKIIEIRYLHTVCIGLCEADIAMSSKEDMYLKWGSVGEGEKGMGMKRGRGSVYSQPGIRVDRNSRHDTEEGFQVSKRGDQGIGVGISEQRGSIKRIGACTSVYHANRVYIVLIVCISR